MLRFQEHEDNIIIYYTGDLYFYFEVEVFCVKKEVDYGN